MKKERRDWKIKSAVGLDDQKGKNRKRERVHVLNKKKRFQNCSMPSFLSSGIIQDNPMGRIRGGTFALACVVAFFMPMPLPVTAHKSQDKKERIPPLFFLCMYKIVQLTETISF